jgi:Immunity protein 74
MGDGGYSVEILGMTGLRYREEGRSIFMDSEMLAVGKKIGAYRNSVKAWDPPNEADLLDEQERSRIIENIRRALEGKGWEFLVIG